MPIAIGLILMMWWRHHPPRPEKPLSALSYFRPVRELCWSRRHPSGTGHPDLCQASVAVKGPQAAYEPK
jgi:hypothetical protein